MTKKPLSEHTVEELQAGLKKLTSTCAVLVTIFGLLFVGIFIYAQMNPDFKMIVPVIALICGVFPAIGILIGNRSKYSDELKKRESQKDQ